MSDATPNPTPANLPPTGIVLKSAAVKLEGLHPSLQAFLRSLGLVAMNLFDLRATVTCAVDAIEHKTGKHPQGKAVDIRVFDVPPAWEDRYLLMILVLCDRYKLTCFDERNLPGAPHFHVEVPS